MYKRKPNNNRSKGQGMVEFALILPVLLTLIFGVIEFSRLLVTYVVTVSASREAARYASAVGGNAAGLPRYRDCDGIRAAARRVGFLAGIQDTDIVIEYDHGPGTSVFENCPVGSLASDTFQPILLGDRVIVQVTGHFQPIVRVIPISITTVDSMSSRSIVRDVAVGTAYQPIPPPPPPGPKIHFASGGSSELEDIADRIVTVVMDEGPSVSDITVPVVVSGTATEGDDFVVVSTFPVIFPAGVVSVDIHLNVIDDSIYESTETVTLQLQAPSGGNATLSSPTVHNADILDNEPVPEVTCNPASLAVNEDAGTFAVSLELDHMSSVDVSVTASVGGTALEFVDYEVVSAFPVVIPAGSTSYPVFIKVMTDTIYEDPETASLKIILANGADIGTPDTCNVTIINTTAPPQVAFELAEQSGTELTGMKPAKLVLDRLSTKPVTVNFTALGTAEVGDDYTLNPASSVIIPPLAQSGLIDIGVIKDSDDLEADETIVLTIGSIVNATRAEPDEHRATIVNKTVRFEAAAQTTPEETAATLLIRAVLNNPSSDKVISVPFTLSGTALAGSDYTLVSPESSVLVFPANTTEAFIELKIVNDAMYEGIETVVITMGEPVNAALVTPSVHTISITETDSAPTVSFVTAAQSAQENAGQMVVIVQLSALAGLDVSVPYGLGGTATLGELPSGDYTITPNPVIIPAGSPSAEIYITINDDDLDENNETVVINMGNPTNAQKGTPATHTATIIDNDATPTVSFTIPNQTVDEDTGIVNVTISLSSQSGRMVTIPFSTSGSAALGSDYTLDPADTAYIPAGSTSTIVVVTVIDDNIPEAEEDVILTMGALVNALPGVNTQHTVRISDNDASQCNDVYNINAPEILETSSGGGIANVKITSGVYNGGPESVTLVGVKLAWQTTYIQSFTKLVLYDMRTNNQIWPSDTRTAESGELISSGWTAAGNRTIAGGNQTTPLVFWLQSIGDGKIKSFSFTSLLITLSNGCTISR